MSFRRPAARRLTLAPTPARPGTGRDEAVHQGVQASLSHGGQARKLSADPLAGQRPLNCGSRFWALAQDLSSDEEEDEVEDECHRFHAQSSWPSTMPACAAGDASATQIPAGELNPNGCLLPSVAGSTPGSKEKDRRWRQDNAAKQKRGPKPWRGPLPAARSSPEFTLADALARARHHTIPARKNSESPGGSHVRRTASSPATTSLVGNRPPDPQDPNFESPRQWTRDLGEGGRAAGKVSGPGRSVQIRLGGRLAHFTFTAGLCDLFARAGRPRALQQSTHAPPSQNASSASSIHSASTRFPGPAVARAAAASGVAERSCNTMDRHGTGGRGRGHNMGRGEEEEQFFEQQGQRDGEKMATNLVIAAGIKEAVLSPKRSSPRLAAAIDQHALEKAKKRAAWRNLDTEGDLQGYILDAHLVAAA